MTYPCTIAVDTHTHTILSGHAWSTLEENAAAAKKAGLYGFAVTDHAPATPGGLHPIAIPGLQMMPKEFNGVRIFSGLEANIMDIDGSLDAENRYLHPLDNVVASLHSLCFKGSYEENTAAYLAAIKNPYIDIIGHLHQADVLCDMKQVVHEASCYGKVIELNASYLHPSRVKSLPLIKEIIGICLDEPVRITVSSDAHFSASVGQCQEMLKLLYEAGFPAERIINLVPESYESWLSDRRNEKAQLQ